MGWDFEGRDGILRDGIPFLSCPSLSLIIPSPSHSYHQLEYTADFFNIGTSFQLKLAAGDR
jgi:hypothetical protein